MFLHVFCRNICVCLSACCHVVAPVAASSVAAPASPAKGHHEAIGPRAVVEGWSEGSVSEAMLAVGGNSPQPDPTGGNDVLVFRKSYQSPSGIRSFVIALSQSFFHNRSCFVSMGRSRFLYFIRPWIRASALNRHDLRIVNARAREKFHLRGRAKLEQGASAGSGSGAREMPFPR